MASRSKTGLARIRPGATMTDQSPAHSALSQASVPGRMNDTLVNLMTGMGTEKDKLTGTVFGYHALHKSQLDAAYRGDWISRKAVDIPAFDSFREWRSWQADKADISAIEDIEKSTKLLNKSMKALIRGRLYGGGAMIMGVDQGISSDELKIETLGKGCLKFVHAVSRWDLGAGPIDWDPMSPYFAEPTYYTITGKQGGTALQIHPSRVVRFCGQEAADPNITDGWGDSILQICADAIIACGTVAQSTAQLIAEAKIDIVKIPEFSEKIANVDYENRLKRRFGLAATMKSVFGMLIVDAAEEWDRIDQTFAGLPDLLKMYLLIVTGAVDVPATRFLGQSPTGLNSTGDSDTRNYYDRVSTEQNIVVSPAMERLDRVLVRSALGTEPDGIFYEWNPLWQMSDTEKGALAVQKAAVMTADTNAGLITPLVMQKARENQLIEDGTYPGLEGLIEEFGDDVDDREAEAAAAALSAQLAAQAANENNAANNDPTLADPQLAPAGVSKPALPSRRAANAPPPPGATSASGAPANGGPAPAATPASRGRAVGDAMAKRVRDAAGKKRRRADAALIDASTPRTLYLRRDVLNADEIKAWAKTAGFATSLDDMHVTIIYSKTPIDWLQAGTDDFSGSDSDGGLTIKAGGPRVMERFGQAIVLAFSSSDLSYRHRSIMYRCEEAGISWEHDDYTPHITISYSADNVFDITRMPAYQGQIVLGPEIFEEINTSFNNETDTEES